MKNYKLWNTDGRKDEIIFIDDEWYILVVIIPSKKAYIGNMYENKGRTHFEGWTPETFPFKKIPKNVLQAYYFYDHILNT